MPEPIGKDPPNPGDTVRMRAPRITQRNLPLIVDHYRGKSVPEWFATRAPRVQIEVLDAMIEDALDCCFTESNRLISDVLDVLNVPDSDREYVRDARRVIPDGTERLTQQALADLATQLPMIIAREETVHAAGPLASRALEFAHAIVMISVAEATVLDRHFPRIDRLERRVRELKGEEGP